MLSIIANVKRSDKIVCTGGRNRTRNLRFWRPPLYQLSYARVSADYPKERSAVLMTKQHRRFCLCLPLRKTAWSWWAGLNCRPHPYQGCALPSELHQRYSFPSLSFATELFRSLNFERETGFEPATFSLGSCDSTTELFPHCCQECGRWTSENERERETGLEPATNSLEGCDSTNWVTPAIASWYYIFRADSRNAVICG